MDGPARRYEWDEVGGVLHVRPVSFRNNRSVVSNRLLASVNVSASGALDALHIVQRLLDPTASGRSASIPPSKAPATVKPFVEKPITVSVSNVTVRELLDQIATDHGSMSWVAEYQDVAGSMKGLKLSFVGFDKWTVSVMLGNDKSR